MSEERKDTFTPNIGKTLELEVFVDPDENNVYVKISGFEELEDAEDYADYLEENLPLLLFESQRIH